MFEMSGYVFPAQVRCGFAVINTAQNPAQNPNNSVAGKIGPEETIFGQKANKVRVGQIEKFTIVSVLKDGKAHFMRIPAELEWEKLNNAECGFRGLDIRAKVGLDERVQFRTLDLSTLSEEDRNDIESLKTDPIVHFDDAGEMTKSGFQTMLQAVLDETLSQDGVVNAANDLWDAIYHLEELGAKHFGINPTKPQDCSGRLHARIEYKEAS